MRPDGCFVVELNQRQQEGPVVTIKAMLGALGATDAEIPLIPVTRELLVSRPPRRKSPAATSDADAEVIPMEPVA